MSGQISFASLEHWKEWRGDKRTERYWLNVEAARPLTHYKQYQKDWNFIEIEYSERPSNNGLDPANPGFVYTTNMAKFIIVKTISIADAGRSAQR